MQKNSHVLEAHATVQRVQMQELSRSEDRVHVLFWKKNNYAIHTLQGKILQHNSAFSKNSYKAPQKNYKCSLKLCETSGL